MHPHHKKAIENLIAYFQNRDEVIAVILGGSVAKGVERVDSDIDAMVIVTPEYYEQKKISRQTAETIDGYCDYPGGYFDIKYYTKAFLYVVAEKGSEPARNAYLQAKVLFSKDDEIQSLVDTIQQFSVGEKAEKMLVFYSDFWLNYYYFWGLTDLDTWFRIRVASEIVYACYRMILQENEVLFPCNRNMERTLRGISNKPQDILSLGSRFMQTIDNASAAAFVDAFLTWLPYRPPTDSSVMLSTYVAYYELWWGNDSSPVVSEW